MNTPVAVDGVLTGYKTMADGSLRLTIGLAEPQAREFHKLFSAINCRVAITQLANEFDQAKGEEVYVDPNSAPW